MAHSGHGSHGGSSGSITFGDHVPSSPYLGQMYWAVVGTAIGIGTAVNVLNQLLHRQRLIAASKSRPTPAKPKSSFFRAYATCAGLVREASNASVKPMVVLEKTIHLPTVGKACMILANLVVLVVLCFYKIDVEDRWSYSDIGYRTGSICIAQLPLLFLLAGRNNLIGWLTGSSYERLNWLHRWVARCLLLTATIHMAYWFADWDPFNYILTRIRTDGITEHGLIAWAILCWIVFSSMAPIRGWKYEFFLVQHLVSFVVFVSFVYLHVPKTTRNYIWIPVGLFLFDHVARASRFIYTNLAIFHPRQRREGSMNNFLACRAVFKPMPHSTTRITIMDPPITWSPGQHVFLSCHSIFPLQSHPFTISSLPADGKIEIFAKAERGWTRRVLKMADKILLPTTTDPGTECLTRMVTIGGPYGRMRPLRQFDTVILIAGGTGATFTTPLLRDLIMTWSQAKNSPAAEKNQIFQIPNVAVTRLIRYIWVVKSRDQLSWFTEQLSKAIQDVELIRQKGRLAVSLEMSIYITCDKSFLSRPSTTTNATHLQRSSASAVLEDRSLSEKLPLEESSPDRDRKRSAPSAPTVREIDPRAESKLAATDTCGPDGSCCCRTTIEDESEATVLAAECRCSNENNEKNRTGSAPDPAPPQPLLHGAIAVLSGRPHAVNVVRKTVEVAVGESAVVACGPVGLVDDVRQATVALSDERAVHRGTGAQGIWFWGEKFNL